MRKLYERTSLGLLCGLSILAFAAVLAWAPAAAAQEADINLPTVPLISLHAIPVSGTAPLTVGFMMNVADLRSEIVSYNWSFGDGHHSTLNPLYAVNTYTKPGNYVVQLTIESADGHFAVATTGVTVLPKLGR